MSDPIHPEGIYECNGCGRIYSEYINGCLSEHLPPRSVRLVVPELPDSPPRLPEKGEPAEPECNGICTTGWDLGLAEYGGMIANAHPDCPLHGEGEPADG